jgi:hypothetical protein
MSHARLTEERRRRNRLALRETLGVSESGTLAAPPGDPRRDVIGGPGFLEVGTELIEMDADDLTDLMADAAPRRPARPPEESRVSAWDVFARLCEEVVSTEGGDEVLEAIYEVIGEEPDPVQVIEHAETLFGLEVIEAAGVADLIGDLSPRSPGVGSSSDVDLHPDTVETERARRRRREIAREFLGRSDPPGQSNSPGDVDAGGLRGRGGAAGRARAVRRVGADHGGGGSRSVRACVRRSRGRATA